MASDAEHPFRCHWALCMSSLEKYLFRSFAYFLTGLFVFLEWSHMSLYIFWRSNPCLRLSLATRFHSWPETLWFISEWVIKSGRLSDFEIVPWRPSWEVSKSILLLIKGRLLGFNVCNEWENVLNISNHHRNANHNLNEIVVHTFRMAIIKEIREKCCWGFRGKGALVHYWWEWKLVQPPGKTV